MSATALTVRCGSCSNVINVPASLLERLLDVRRFNCPHCRQGQQLNPEILHAMLRKSSENSHKDIGQSIYDVLRGGVNNDDSTNASRKSSSSRAHGRDITGGRRHFSDRIPVDEDADEEASEDEEHEPGDVFADYRPSKLHFGRPHPDPVVETASLAAVEPPDITYELHIQDLVDGGNLSGLQLESIVYACQRHEQVLPSGSRTGFFIGDGAGVGKGRTIAGLILENWRCGRRRHLWISIGSDLKVDARRDMDDVGAREIDIHALNKLQYGQLDGDKIGVMDGVMFLSYSSLISGCDNGQTRFDQMAEWCGEGFDGLIVFDECHKAKNLVPEAGAKPTKVGRLVLELQQKLPLARVVYCSATGASEPRNMGYMERLGLWGEGSAFPQFSDFLDVIGSRGVGALEMVAMDMKARGMYVCRTLSFKGAEFEIVESALEEPVRTQYKTSAKMWNQLRREFLYALEQASPMDEEQPKRGTSLWRFFWASHQRFFRHMCMAAKVPALVRMTQQALRDNKCVVIGLQSTGEARTQDVVAERGEELDDFVSGPRELLLKLVEDYYPLPLNPDAQGPVANGKPPAGPKGGKKRKAPAAAGKGRKRTRIGSDSDAKEEGEEGAAGPASESAGAFAAVSTVDDHWERKQGSGQAGPSYAKTLSATLEGQQQLQELRRAFSNALKRKEQVKSCMAGLDLPHNPLDMLIDLLGGPDKVAEMTGRKGRLVRMKRGEGEEDDGTKLGVKWEARNASGVGTGATLEMINVLERSLFLDDVKHVAIISEAASAGISLHADKRAKNQKRRVHLTLELPWSADKAIQQFGRSHRANQAHGPQYRLLFTPLGGERRFASSVARRLESLGALTQGDRKAGPSLSAFNYESVWGQRALRRFYRVVLGDEKPFCGVPACQPDLRGKTRFTEHVFLGKTRAQLLGVGIIKPLEDAIHVNMYMSQENGAPAGVGKVSDGDKADVSRFLNRLLGLEPEWQTYLFDFYQAVMEYVVAEAKREGKFEDGIVDFRATSVVLKGAPRARVVLTLASRSELLAERAVHPKGGSKRHYGLEPLRCPPCPQVIRTDPTTKAPTVLYKIVTDRGVSWHQACEMLRAHTQEAVIDLEAPQQPGVAHGVATFYRSTHILPGSGKHGVVLALPQGSRRDRTFIVVRPNTGRQPKPMPADVFASRYQNVASLVARQLWEEAHLESERQQGVGSRLRELQLLSGLVLPIWPEVEMCLSQEVRASQRRLNVMRLETTAPEQRRLVGVLLSEAAVQMLLQRLATSRQEDEVIDLDSSD